MALKINYRSQSSKILGIIIAMGFEDAKHSETVAFPRIKTEIVYLFLT